MALPSRQHTNPYAAPTTLSSPTHSSYGSPQPAQAYNTRQGWPYSGSFGPQRRDAAASNAVGSGWRLVKRLFKFPQMDFEVAVWEMTGLIWAPRKVWRTVWYRKQTKNTYTATDPAFPYLLSLFLTLTSLAWSIAYASPSLAHILRIAFFFVFVHFLGLSLLVAAATYLLLPRLFSHGGWADRYLSRLTSLLGRRARRGLFSTSSSASSAGAPSAVRDELEFAFCLDVALRSFTPLWLFLYIVQFLLLPAVTSHRFFSTFLANTLHAFAFSHAAYVTFLGFNTLPSLGAQGRELAAVMLVPPLVLVWGVMWFGMGLIGGWNASLNLAPVLWCGGKSVLRKNVGGG